MTQWTLGMLIGALLLLAPEDGSHALTDRVILQPLGRASQADIRTAQKGISRMFNASVTIALAKPLPKAVYYTPRKRCRAEKLLDYLRQTNHGIRTIALTSADISTTNNTIRDWGVLGPGNLGGRECVVSTFRMGKSRVTSDVYRSRLVSTVNHELGHTYGLPHCPNPGCLMQDAKGKISTVDGEWRGFCPQCRAKLGTHLSVAR